jgi:hypothetical protein
MAVNTVTAELGLIPPARLGPFVGLARRTVGLSAEELANQSDGRLTAQDVKLLERGRLVCSEVQLEAIEQLLGMSFGEHVPTRTRLVVDPLQGRMVLGGSVAEVVPDPTGEELLMRYLMLVYLCRKARPGSFIVPRAEDVTLLADVLERRPAEVRQALARLVREERDGLRVGVQQLSNRRFIPGLGLLVGAHHRGGLLLVEAESLETTGPRRVDEDTSAVVLQLPQKHVPQAHPGYPDDPTIS